MLRSMLVALDGSSSSIMASDVAFQLAGRDSAHVTGLGVVNASWIQRPEPVPLGAIAMKAALDLSRLRTARERVDAVLHDFKTRASHAGVGSYDTRLAEGDPLHLVAAEATAHDLVVLGRNTVFDVEGEPRDLPVCVDRIVRDEPRPILMIPPGINGSGATLAEGPLLVAFDGSAAASRAVHMCALLGLSTGRTVHVVSVGATATVAADSARRACDLLARHDAAEARPLGLGDREAGTPSETILGLAKSLGASMIVMGAYGRRGIREFFGSTTREVLNACPTALFLHH